jgi:hypothetical protein
LNTTELTEPITQRYLIGVIEFIGPITHVVTGKMIPRRMMNKVQSGVFGDTGNKQPYQFGELDLRPSIFTPNHVTEVGPFILRAQRITYVCSKILHKSHARA